MYVCMYVCTYTHVLLFYSGNHKQKFYWGRKEIMIPGMSALYQAFSALHATSLSLSLYF